MRISDWSSDVCSSDLDGAVGGARPVLPGERSHPADHPGRPRGPGGVRSLRGPCADRRLAGRDGAARRSGQQPARRDRKSAVEGKGVSVRVVLGGRRFIKKKTRWTTTTKEYHNE